MNIRTLIKNITVYLFFMTSIVLLSGCGPALIAVGAGAASYYSYSKDKTLDTNGNAVEEKNKKSEIYVEKKNKIKNPELKKIKPLKSEKKIIASKNTYKEKKKKKLKKPISIVGKSDSELVKSIGDPMLKKIEKNSAMWVYKNNTCILYIFFYKTSENYKRLTSTYFDFTPLHNIDDNSNQCVNSFFSEKPV